MQLDRSHDALKKRLGFPPSEDLPQRSGEGVGGRFPVPPFVQREHADTWYTELRRRPYHALSERTKMTGTIAQLKDRTSPEGLPTELAGYREQFRANRARAGRLCARMTLRRFNWRPELGRWSVAECLTHLNLTASLFAEAVQRAIDRGRAKGLLGSEPFRYGMFSRWFLGVIDPANRKRYKAPRRLTPEPEVQHEIGQVLHRFQRTGDEWERLLHEANGLDLARVKVPSPIFPLLRVQLGAVFAVQSAHERRHLLQAEEVTKTPGFPPE